MCPRSDGMSHLRPLHWCNDKAAPGLHTIVYGIFRNYSERKRLPETRLRLSECSGLICLSVFCVFVFDLMADFYCLSNSPAVLGDIELQMVEKSQLGTSLRKVQPLPAPYETIPSARPKDAVSSALTAHRIMNLYILYIICMLLKPQISPSIAGRRWSWRLHRSPYTPRNAGPG